MYSVTSLTVSKARANLFQLVDQVNINHEQALIIGKRHNAVLISEEDWRAIQETLFLLSIPGMRESIREGMETPLSETTKDPDW